MDAAPKGAGAVVAAGAKAPGARLGPNGLIAVLGSNLVGGPQLLRSASSDGDGGDDDESDGDDGGLEDWDKAFPAARAPVAESKPAAATKAATVASALHKDFDSEGIGGTGRGGGAGAGIGIGLNSKTTPAAHASSFGGAGDGFGTGGGFGEFDEFGAGGHAASGAAAGFGDGFDDFGATFGEPPNSSSGFEDPGWDAFGSSTHVPAAGKPCIVCACACLACLSAFLSRSLLFFSLSSLNMALQTPCPSQLH